MTIEEIMTEVLGGKIDHLTKYCNHVNIDERYTIAKFKDITSYSDEWVDESVYYKSFINGKNQDIHVLI